MLNAILFCTVIPYQIRRVLQLQHPESRGVDASRRKEAVESPTLTERTHITFNICLYPPLFFFSVLYYTDVLSASCVLATYIVFLQRHQTHHASLQDRSWPMETAMWGLGLYALLLRQTNIFWVAIFLAGLEVIRVVKHINTTSWDGDSTSIPSIVNGSWEGGKIYDPLVRDARIEGLPHSLLCSVSVSD